MNSPSEFRLWPKADKRMTEATIILQKNLLNASFEVFDQTINIEAFLPNGQIIYFIAGTANDRFDLQWHSTTNDEEGIVIEGDCNKPCFSNEDHLPLSVDASKLARWIRQSVLATIDQVFHDLRIKAIS